MICLFMSRTLPNTLTREIAMRKTKKRTEVSPNHPVARLTLEQQFMVVSSALNRATQQGNTKAINGLAMMLKGYEEAIAKQKQQAK